MNAQIFLNGLQVRQDFGNLRLNIIQCTSWKALHSFLAYQPASSMNPTEVRKNKMYEAFLFFKKTFLKGL